MARLVGLLALVAEHEAAIEADLSHYHRLSLADVGTRRLTWRRFQALILHLPSDAALWRSAGSPRQWGWMEHLTAGVLHTGQAGNWQRGGGKGSRPKPLKPPGNDAGKSRKVGTALGVDEMRRVLDTWTDGEVTDGD